MRHSYPHQLALQGAGDLPRHAAMVRRHRQAVPGSDGKTLRELALAAIDETKWYPPRGENRIGAMVEGRPDWVLSRQRAWGVPLAIFVDKKSGEVLNDPAVFKRIERRLRGRRRRCLVHLAAGALPGRGPQGRRLRAGERHSGCLVRFRLDPCLHGGKSHRSALAARPITPIFIWKAPTSIAAGSSPRCWKASARAAARPTRAC